MKQQLGCWLHERWRTELVLRVPRLAERLGLRWLDLCNRHERLFAEPDHSGRRCDWAGSSRLTVTRMFPALGPRLLRHCLRHWPVCTNVRDDSPVSDRPQVSVLIAIGGTDRLPQFELTLASLRGQAHEAYEIIVVEQSATPALADRLSSDIRYAHVPIGKDGFNKSAAINRAAEMARGEELLVHDADYVVPQAYVAECSAALKRCVAVRPGRLLFYLDEASTRAAIAAGDVASGHGIEAVVQNNPTPIAVRRSAYEAVGGHDEEFVGWGGEDDEFLSRLQTQGMIGGGWMPVIHLWHPPAPRKASGDRNRQLTHAKMAIPAKERIRRLQTRAQIRLGTSAVRAGS
ncbi:MAG: glycosyltransferase [Maioricimonas sp. JB049]